MVRHTSSSTGGKPPTSTPSSPSSSMPNPPTTNAVTASTSGMARTRPSRTPPGWAAPPAWREGCVPAADRSRSRPRRAPATAAQTPAVANEISSANPMSDRPAVAPLGAEPQADRGHRTPVVRHERADRDRSRVLALPCRRRAGLRGRSPASTKPPRRPSRPATAIYRCATTDERRRVTHMTVSVPLPSGRVLPHA